MLIFHHLDGDSALYVTTRLNSVGGYGSRMVIARALSRSPPLILNLHPSTRADLTA